MALVLMLTGFYGEIKRGAAELFKDILFTIVTIVTYIYRFVRYGR